MPTCSGGFVSQCLPGKTLGSAARLPDPRIRIAAPAITSTHSLQLAVGIWHILLLAPAWRVANWWFAVGRDLSRRLLPGQVLADDCLCDATVNQPRTNQWGNFPTGLRVLQVVVGAGPRQKGSFARTRASKGGENSGVAASATNYVSPEIPVTLGDGRHSVDTAHAT
jgi:hypothetical protein